MTNSKRNTWIWAKTTYLELKNRSSGLIDTKPDEEIRAVGSLIQQESSFLCGPFSHSDGCGGKKKKRVLKLQSWNSRRCQSPQTRLQISDVTTISQQLEVKNEQTVCVWHQTCLNVDKRGRRKLPLVFKVEKEFSLQRLLPFRDDKAV